MTKRSPPRRSPNHREGKVLSDWPKNDDGTRAIATKHASPARLLPVDRFRESLDTTGRSEVLISTVADSVENRIQLVGVSGCWFTGRPTLIGSDAAQRKDGRG